MVPTVLTFQRGRFCGKVWIKSVLFLAVDAKTMETAEKLAKFVAQVGPEIEQFSIDNSADNPDLW